MHAYRNSLYTGSGVQLSQACAFKHAYASEDVRAVRISGRNSSYNLIEEVDYPETSGEAIPRSRLKVSLSHARIYHIGGVAKETLLP